MSDLAALLNAPRDPIAVEEVVLDEPGPSEVRVRLLACGVCRSDLYVQETGGWGMPFPIALGHEGAGEVEAVGEGVTDLVPGDRVVLAWRAPCDGCRICENVDPRLCPYPLRAKRRTRRARDGAVVTPTLLCGALATRTTVHHGGAIKIPRELPPEQACLLGCAVATGVGAVLNTSPVWPGARVGVIGCGGVGLSIVQGARIAGAAEIVAVDIDERKLEQAARLGATRVTTDAAETAGSVDLSFDAVARPETMAAAVRMLEYAGIATLIGLPHSGSAMTLDLYDLFDSRAQIRVSHGGDIIPAEDIPRIAALALEGELDLGALVTREIGLDEVEDAFAAMRAGDVVRSVVRFA